MTSASVSVSRWGGRAHDLLVLGGLAALVGLIHIYPDLRFLQQPAYRHSGMHLAGAADEPYYLSRLDAVLRGVPHRGNAAIYEHRDDPSLMPPLPELVQGGLGRLLGWSLRQADIFWTFVMPTVIVLLFYHWLGYFTGSFWTRVVGALSVSLGFYWFSLDPRVLATVWEHGLPPLALMRPISPSWHFTWLLVALAALFRCLTKQSVGSALVAGLAAGFTWYTSVYFSSFLAVFLGLMIAAALLRRDWLQLRGLLVVLVCLGVLAVPFLLNASQIRLSPAFGDLSERCGAVFTRQPILPTVQVVSTAIIALGLQPSTPQQRWWFLACLLAGWMCLNQHLLTGWTVQPAHWQSVLIKPMVIAGLVLTAGTRLAAAWRWRRRTAAVMAAVGLVMGTFFVLQERYYRWMSHALEPRLALSGACQWLRTQAGVDEVVLTNPMDFEQAEWVGLYGGTYVYCSDPFFITSLLSRREIEHRYLAALRFYGYTPDEAQALFRAAGGGGLFVGLQVAAWRETQDPAQAEYLASLDRRYERHLLQDPFQGLRPYRATYALLTSDDVERLGRRQPLLLSRLSPVYEDRHIVLYRILEHLVAPHAEASSS